jgi:protease-4
MINDLRRLLAMGVATPLRALHRGLHAVQTGRHAILEVTIEDGTDLHGRQALLTALERVRHDDRVEAVLFQVEGAPGGRAAIQDLRAAILAVADAGKATYAMLQSATNATMWIASAAQHVFLVPTGDVNLVGYGTELLFFGAALERLGLRADVEAAGEYKSAGEMFTRSFASPANLEATDVLLGDLQDQLDVDLMASRGLAREQLDAVYAAAPLSAEEAVVSGLVDRLLYADQLDTWLAEHHGERAKRIPIAQWSRRVARLENLARWGDDTRAIVVVHLEGPIVMDEKRARRVIRAKQVVPLLDELREDDDVAAVVLQINSPGGGVLPSDLIWRAVDRLRQEKPVVASFEDVSASGGVYLSAPATEVVARPGTITGSVGVVGMKFVAGEGMRRLGVMSQAVLKAPNATLFSVTSPFTDAQRERFREQLQRWYDGFVHRVASGRGKADEAIEPFCRGRVWTGRMALERGLVDRIGTLADAIERARVLAGLPPRVRRLDLDAQPDSWRQRLIRQLLDGSPLPVGATLSLAERVVGRALGTQAMERVDFLLEHEGQALALLPFQIDEPRR